MAAQQQPGYDDQISNGPDVGGGGFAGPVTGAGDPSLMGPYPDGVPDFRDPEQAPNPDYYAPNEDVDQYGYQTGVNGEKNYDVNVGMTGGLMDTISAIEDSPYANNGYRVRGGRATNRTVNPNETSQWQLEQMLASDSPLMRQAAAQGMARGGSRGTMNSSMATGAAQGSMIAGAQPFALQDASWYGQTAADNMNATNSMSEANLRARTASMEARSRRDSQILQEQLSGYGDIRKAMINIEDREDTQVYGTDERLGQEEYQADQNQLNRDWTSNENMLTNSLAWAQTKIDAATRMNITREQAFSDMYASIMNNANPKFKAADRNQAVRNMKATLDARYGEGTGGAYENSYDPATGRYDESLKPPPVDPQAAASAASASSTGGEAAVAQFYNPQMSWMSNPGAQMYGSRMGETYGLTTARLPAV